MTLRAAMRDGLTDVACCTRFYSRLPVPAFAWETDPHGAPDFAAMARMLPVAGALLGCIGAAVLATALSLGLGPWLSATLAVAALTLVTGAFHEDGLADTADSLGGSSRERRLDIMRDSRIGSFGAAALILAFALRIAALATLAERLEVVAVAAGVIAVASVSRTAGLVVFTFLPPARLDGASYALGPPTPRTLLIAVTLCVALTLLLLLGWTAAMPLSAVGLTLLLPTLVAFGMTVLSKKLVGGHTGDVGGAIQQISEIAALLGLLIALRP
jgi:adenosylcobinamide-GDP ribazoletransferase